MPPHPVSFWLISAIPVLSPQSPLCRKPTYFSLIPVYCHATGSLTSRSLSETLFLLTCLHLHSPLTSEEPLLAVPHPVYYSSHQIFFTHSICHCLTKCIYVCFQVLCTKCKFSEIWYFILFLLLSAVSEVSKIVSVKCRHYLH